MNPKILALFALIPLLLMPVASSHAMSSNDQMSMKDKTTMKKEMSMKDKAAMKKETSMKTKMDKMRHMTQTNIPNPYFFQIDDTTITTNRGTVTIAGHGEYNPEQNMISAWGTYSLAMGSRVINGNWKATSLVSGTGNPYGGDSDDSHVNFIGMTVLQKDPKFTGNNAKRESFKRGGHQILIYADAAEGKLCVYGAYVGTPTPRNACVETDTISITH